MRPAAFWTVPPPVHAELVTVVPVPPPAAPTVKEVSALVAVLAGLARSFAMTCHFQLPFVKPLIVADHRLLAPATAANDWVAPLGSVSLNVTLWMPLVSVTMAEKVWLAPIVAPEAGLRPVIAGLIFSPLPVGLPAGVG